ncbi:outer membrane export protein [Bordetella ansorpii]|uniref:Outer membrane export protein n=1 Tax=Bordetella ansorpii TaxID=288768 RepID=A0A157QM39_9BORD|nr:TolC family outer membrane protein [Bordetella ansorpii]SAI46708.1 outer membrane export protein [Bordetella ansorpii]
MFFAVACLVSWAGSAQALDLMQAYGMALEHDPAYRASIAERNAGREERAIGRAALLPKLSYQYQVGRNDSRVTQPGFFGSTTSDRHYNSYSSALTLQQPLLDYEALSRYYYGVAQSLHADSRFRSRSQELAVRVAKAYTETLYARDQIDLSRAQKRAYAEQLVLNERMLRAGEGTRTDLLETQARHDLAVAQEIEALDAQDAAQRALAAMIGIPVAADDLAPLSGKFEAMVLEREGFSSWQQLALRENPELAALTFSIDAAQERIEQARAGHLPSVSLYASAGRQKSSSESSYDQRYATNSIGVQINVPIFAGGGVSASVRQATDNREKLRYERDARRDEILNGLRQQFNLHHSSLAKMRAYGYAVESARELTTAMKRSVAGGERVNADVLQAEQQYFDALRNLAQARYEHLMSWLTLQQLAGSLEPEDVLHVNGAFARTAEHAVKEVSISSVPMSHEAGPHDYER